MYSNSLLSLTSLPSTTLQSSRSKPGLAQQPALYSLLQLSCYLTVKSPSRKPAEALSFTEQPPNPHSESHYGSMWCIPVIKALEGTARKTFFGLWSTWLEPSLFFRNTWAQEAALCQQHWWRERRWGRARSSDCEPNESGKWKRSMISAFFFFYHVLKTFTNLTQLWMMFSVSLFKFNHHLNLTLPRPCIEVFFFKWATLSQRQHLLR